MAPSTAAETLLSPAELSYLHSSLSLTPPIRSDLRSPTQFRPLVAETDILPGTNGSARICFADGTEAIVGVKAEVEKSRPTSNTSGGLQDGQDEEMRDAEEGRGRGESEWVELTIEIPGHRDDDALPVFLAAMLSEALLATGDLPGRLWINTRFHWTLYIDILLLSPPLSYPLPLLSLTTHLALLCTRLPALVSEAAEDPLFDDDWAASAHLYPRPGPSSTATPPDRPPVTLLVMVVADNVVFDPTREELAVADAVLAVSVVGDAGAGAGAGARLVGVRMVDPPSRLMAAGGLGGGDSATEGEAGEVERGVWRAPRGGVKRGLVGRVVKMVVEKGGVGEEVLRGLEGVDVG